MKRVLRQSQFWRICETVSGLYLWKYGVPYGGASGFIDPEHVDHILAAVERFDAIHIVSFDKDGNGVNHFVENAAYFYLCLGDKDPEIEIIPQVWLEDYSDEEHEEERKFLERYDSKIKSEDLVAVAAANWIRSKVS